jgi:hypothetical protein
VCRSQSGTARVLQILGLNKSTCNSCESAREGILVDHRAAVDAATQSSASEDWDVVGSDAEDAPAGIASMGRSELSHTPERSMLDDSFSTERLDRVPMFDTGEPQYTWGHGGGRPPPTSHIYMAVLALSGNDEIHSHEVLF